MKRNIFIAKKTIRKNHGRIDVKKDELSNEQ